jgi:hypothetical protein
VLAHRGMSIDAALRHHGHPGLAATHAKHPPDRH